MPHLGPTGSSSGQPPSITARYFSSYPSDSTSRWTPCPPEYCKERLQVHLGCIQLSPSCPFRLLHTSSLLRPARHYSRLWIQRPSSGRRRDFNPPEQRAAQRTLRLLLTSARRSGGLSTTSVAEATPSRSPGVSSTAFRAQSPNLRFAPLMDMDFAISCPLVRCSRLVSDICQSTRTFVPCFLQTPPRGGSPCIITRPYLHQVGQRTFTSKLLSMPSTQRSRQTADAFARFPALSWFPGQRPTQLAM